jgi:ectoine hydroxylase-related dioxygenase (phytanoyl-CoA dioxygenase family)
MNQVDSPPRTARQPSSKKTALPCCAATGTDWLPLALEGIRRQGYAVVTGVLPASFLAETHDKLYAVRDRIQDEIGIDRLRRAGELGVLRLMLKYEPHFFRFLEIPQLLEVVDATVSANAIMHLQNGFILPSFSQAATPTVFQNQYHMDFPRVCGGYLASINVMFAIDAFTAENGGTIVVPGTHQRAVAPTPEYLRHAGIPVECPAGAMVLFDSTLWHAAGRNISGCDRLAINHQFTRSWIKQQIDYVRALGDEVVTGLPARTQQLLGWYTRVVTSLDEYYRPEEGRLYRRGQG